MFLTASVILAAIIVWSLVSGRMTRWYVTAPIALILLGMAAGWETSEPLIESLTSTGVERTVEVVLSLLLFLDALEIKDAPHKNRTPVFRMLFLALPLSLFVMFFVAAYLLPDVRLSLCLVLACILVPSDLAPASSLVKDRRIPARVRNLLNVESGYNDAIVAPFFLFGLAVLGQGEHAEDPGEALVALVPALVMALVVGAVVGAALGWGIRLAHTHGWAEIPALRLVTLATPLLAYTLAMQVSANGFVAAFIAGLVFRTVVGDLLHELLEFTEGVATFAIMPIWFVLGQLTALVIQVGPEWDVALVVLIALTLGRAIPVFLATTPSRLTWPERATVAWLGPRGIASIVFALLAIQEGDEGQVDVIIQAVVMVVFLSVMLHGLTAPLIGRAFEKRRAPALDSALDPAAT